jgi:hypothetical protein
MPIRIKLTVYTNSNLRKADVKKIMQDYALSLLSDTTPAWPQGVPRVVRMATVNHHYMEIKARRPKSMTQAIFDYFPGYIYTYTQVYA